MSDVTVGADVVKVSVGKDVSLDFVLVLFQVGDVWNNVVNTWVVATGEQESTVDEHHFVAVFDRHHVLADTHFANTTDWNNLKRWALRSFTLRLIAKAKLLAAIAVIDRLINRDVDHMLRCTGGYAFTCAALGTKNLTFTRLCCVKDGVI